MNTLLKAIVKNSFFLFLFIGFSFSAIQSKPFIAGDYALQPVREVDYTQLIASLKADIEKESLSGELFYSFIPKHPYVKELSWYAPGIEIEAMVKEGGEVAHEMQGDTLKIYFDDFLQEEKTVTIELKYRSYPKFGVHFSTDGTVFTSNLPGSTGHWLPGPLHPAVSMPVRFEMEVPAGMVAAAPGTLQIEEINEEFKSYQWISDNPIPLSMLSFALGDFYVENAFIGNKEVRLHYAPQDFEEKEAQELLSYTIQQIRDSESHLRSEFPYAAFNLLLINDLFWETRHTTTGMAYLPADIENIRSMISYCIISQWYGSQFRSAAWQEASFIILLQALVAEALQMDTPDLIEDPIKEAFEIPKVSYRLFDIEYFKRARNYILEHESSFLVRIMKSYLGYFAGLQEAWTSDDFSRFLYKKTGRWLQIPDLSHYQPKPIFEFHVNIKEQRGTNELLLQITPLGKEAEEAVGMNIFWNRNRSIEHKKIYFKGKEKEIRFDPGGAVLNAWIEAPEGRTTSFIVDKPFSFWLYQLRNDDDPKRRKDAAMALKNHVDDPDLELAVWDVLNREKEPGVLHVIYELFSKITKGASGREAFFIDGLQHSQPAIRGVSMKALRAYVNNDNVRERVLNVIQSSDDISLVNEAITTYRHLIDEEEFKSFALQFLREDRDDQLFTKRLLSELFNLSIDEITIETAREYLNQAYPFDIRRLSYFLLRLNAPSSEWERGFVENFLNDNDPRIRFFSLFSLNAVDANERAGLLEKRMTEEYDLRVLEQIRKQLKGK